MLNPQQTAAVQYIDGPLLVLAGAGSGKTRVITQKIVYLIEKCAYSPKNIVAVTFTNKAAQEMRTRIALAIPAEKRRGLKIATFHTLGLQIIKRDLMRAHLRAGFSIFDSEDSLQLLKSFLPAAKGQDKDYLTQIQGQISKWKNDLLGPEDLKIKGIASEDTMNPIFEEARLLYARYQQSLRAYNAVDFDDLILIPANLLTHFPDIKEYWQNKIRHLLIDEYQDSNTSQYVLVTLLTGVRAQFTVVGDDDQSIYAWRGARPEQLVQLKEDYPLLKIVKLEQNYRSSTRILQAANRLIAHNPHVFEKKLWSNLGSGEMIRVLACKNEQDEAEQVIADLRSHKIRFGKKYSDYAILYRGNHQSRLFEKILRHHGIAYKLSGGQSWFARAEIKDIFAYLKILCNEQDDASFLRAINTPKRGIGEQSLESLGKYAASQKKGLYQCAHHLALRELITEKPRQALESFQQWMEGLKQKLTLMPSIEILREMVEDCAYEAHIYEQHDSPLKAQKCMDNVWELIDWIGRLLEKKPGQTLVDVINTLILIDRLEQADVVDHDCVQLMTLHASKGLEFPHVYLVGMEEGLLPHRVSIEGEHIEEERRLAYVGITRAQTSLCFSLAKQRKRQDGLENCLPSRFLDELSTEGEGLEWFGKTEARDEAKSKALAKSHLDVLKSMLVGG